MCILGGISTKRSALLASLLMVSLAANVWLGLRLRREGAQVRQGVAQLAWGTNYALNGLVRAIDDPGTDWNSPGFRTSLLEFCEWGMLYSQVAGSTMGGPATGPYGGVVSQLNTLGFTMSDYRSVAMRVATGPVTPNDQAKLLSLAANLRAAGWPRDPISRDDTQGWTAFADALARFEQLEQNTKRQ